MDFLLWITPNSRVEGNYTNELFHNSVDDLKVNVIFHNFQGDVRQVMHQLNKKMKDQLEKTNTQVKHLEKQLADNFGRTMNSFKSSFSNFFTADRSAWMEEEEDPTTLWDRVFPFCLDNKSRLI